MIKMIGNLSKSKTLMGEKGEKGNDGYSPKVTVTDIENGHEVTIQDAYGLHSFVLKNGDKGEDGISPIVNVTATEEGLKIEITDKEGKKEFVINDGGIVPDWNQNDETAPDYIKNRTHYAETKSIVSDDYIDFDGAYIINFTSDFELNRTYHYNVNGTVGTVKFTTEDETVDICGTNCTLYSLIENDATSYYLAAWFAEDAVVDFYEEAVVPLPEKYIPDSIARVADVEEMIGIVNDELESILAGGVE